MVILMSIFKKFICVCICIMLAVVCFTGCADKYMDAIIYFELLEQPHTLDPQTAQSDSELLIVRNIYEGLMRESQSGEIVAGVAESYSYENLTYTFNLRDDAKWSNGDSVTAYDFEYAFRRALDPKINAPFAHRLFSISGAEAVASGNADTSSLGVKAVDDKTFQITMCQEDADFLKTLTTSVCMPCNETFFEESVGKYGLEVECTVSNGSYQITKWNKEDFGIRLYRNEQYNGDFLAQNAAVFISCVDDESQISRLNVEESDMAFISGSEVGAASKNDLSVGKVQNICWVMTISRNFSPEIRKSFAMAFSSDVYKNSLPASFSVAKSIYPQILDVNADGVGITEYDAQQSKSIMLEQVSLLPDGKFPSSTLYYYGADGVKGLATAIVGHWQQNFGTFINIEASDNINALKEEIGESSLDFALFPITVRSKIFSEYAANFASLSTMQTPDKLQKEILDTHIVIPVAYQSTDVCFIPTLENVVLHDDNGYIDFSCIIKR